jgi:hypothetical protein
MRLSRKLAKQAKKHNICSEWHGELKGLNDKPAMVDMYLKGIDFCLANNYPSNDFIRDNFKGMMEEHGVFLDDNVNLEANGRSCCVALGKTGGNISIVGFGACEIYVKHDSELSITAKDDAFVMIDLFDNGKIQVHAHDRAKVCVNKYGGEVSEYQTDKAVIKVIQKHKKTY